MTCTECDEQSRIFHMPTGMRFCEQHAIENGFDPDSSRFHGWGRL